jgi:hypothetical protein
MPPTIPRANVDLAALSPAASAALATALAELLTVECEQCSCATASGDLCPVCEVRTRWAISYRQLAAEGVSP